MANPTTNYGFVMPTNTDLVKDLPADFDVFGQAVDTKIKDLNPETTAGDISYRGAVANAKTRLGIGTARQVLAVNAGATAPEWVPSASSTLTTTGDLLYASAANTLARRAIGSTGDVLTVSGGLPTWAAPASGGMTSIASGSLSGSLLTLSGISGTYNNLVMVIRGYRFGTATPLRASINNDNGANRYLIRNYNAANAGALTFSTTEYQVTDSPNTSQGQGLSIITFFDYANTSSWKMVNVNTIHNDITTSTSAYVNNIFAFYNQTAAITRLDFYVNGTTFSTGTYTLYGVK